MCAFIEEKGVCTLSFNASLKIMENSNTNKGFRPVCNKTTVNQVQNYWQKGTQPMNDTKKETDRKFA